MEFLEEAYRWLWTHTTGRPYTEIIRDDPWLLIVPAAVIITVTAVLLPRRFWARVVILYLGLSTGLVAGHAFF